MDDNYNSCCSDAAITGQIDILRSAMADQPFGTRTVWPSLPSWAPAVSTYQAMTTSAVSTTACPRASQTTTISNHRDLVELITNCDAYHGDILITNYADVEIDGDRLISIVGDLSINSSDKVRDISFAQLQFVTGKFSLSGSFADSVAYSFDALKRISELDISNTDLYNFDIVDKAPLLASIGSFTATSNKNLANISLPIKSFDNVEISDNDGFPSIVLEYLVTVNKSANFKQVRDFEAPVLKNVEGDLVFDKNHFASLALDALVSVAGTFNITDSYGLANLSLKDLKSVGMPGHDSMFTITPSKPENAYLNNITLPALSTVHGAIYLQGNFSEVGMPELREVTGDLHIQDNRSSDLALCASVLQNYGSQISTLPITCNGNSIHATAITVTSTAATTATSTSTTSSKSSDPTSSSSSGLSTGAKAGIGIGAALAGILALLLIALFLISRDKKRLATRQRLAPDQPKTLDYSPMFGETATSIPLSSQYQDDDNVEDGGRGFVGAGVEGSSANLNARDDMDHLRANVERPVSPISMGEAGQEVGGRGSTRSVSPESVGRLSLRDGRESGLAM